MDTKYLYKRNNVWWVKLAVPSALRSKLGYDLRKSTGQTDVEKAIALIVNGFSKEVLNKLPMEFAVEAQKLLEISLEGSVG